MHYHGILLSYVMNASLLFRMGGGRKKRHCIRCSIVRQCEAQVLIERDKAAYRLLHNNADRRRGVTLRSARQQVCDQECYILNERMTKKVTYSTLCSACQPACDPECYILYPVQRTPTSK